MDPEIAHDYPQRGKLGKLPAGIPPGRELTAQDNMTTRATRSTRVFGMAYLADALHKI